MLCEASEESPEAKGLGVLPTEARRFPDSVRVPQIGWNFVNAATDSSWMRDGYAYFANSFRVADPPGDGWTCAMSDHAGPFVAAIERGNVLGCQFHPELSGRWGTSLLARWLAHGGASVNVPDDKINESRETSSC